MATIRTKMIPLISLVTKEPVFYMKSILYRQKSNKSRTFIMVFSALMLYNDANTPPHGVPYLIHHVIA